MKYDTNKINQRSNSYHTMHVTSVYLQSLPVNDCLDCSSILQFPGPISESENSSVIYRAKDQYNLSATVSDNKDN